MSRLERWGSATLRLRWQLLLALAVGAAPGHFLFPVVMGRLGALIDNRQLALADRAAGVIFVAASVLAMALAFLVFRRLRARGDAPERWDETLRAWNGATFWLLGLPLVAALAVPKVETSHPWLVFFATAALAALAVATAYRWRPLLSLPRKRSAGLALSLLVVGYGLLFSLFSIRQHHSFLTHTYDLAIYDSLFWNAWQGKGLASTLMRGGTHLSAHFDPILVLLSPIYGLAPRAETILILQAFWLALGAIPLFLLARKKLESPWLALALAAIYLLYPALHGVNLYDFHSLALAGPLLLAIVAALELGRLRVYWAFVALALLVREDIPLMLLGVGLYAGVVSRRWRLGLVTIAVSAAYLLVVKLFIMPDPGLFMKASDDVHGYAYYYRDMMGKGGSRTGDMLASLIANPVFVLKHLATAEKLRFFALLFLPLLFLPLLGGRRLVLLAYGFAFLFLSSRKQVHSIHFQYSTVLFPFAMAILPSVLAEIRGGSGVGRLVAGPRRLSTALVVGMLVSTAALSAKFGPLLPNASFKAGFSTFVRAFNRHHQETKGWLDETLATIPEDASISATNLMGPHASNRDLIYRFPKKADYLLLHRRELKGKKGAKLRALKREEGYEVIAEHREVMLLERGEAKPDEVAPRPRRVGPMGKRPARFVKPPSRKKPDLGHEPAP